MMRRANALALVVLAGLLAACGSSNSGSAPGASATIPATTPLNSPIVRGKFVSVITKDGIPRATAKREAGKIADCAITKLLNAGVSTSGQLKDVSAGDPNSTPLARALGGCAWLSGLTRFSPG
jgi:hypothetical protein